MEIQEMQKLIKPSGGKIVMLVMDGLGGLPGNEKGQTELEAAATPNLDALAAKSICGLHLPVGAGITPGSGPSHIALFGYDPIRYQIGRGVLEALGVDFDLQPQDVAARGNFCSLDEKGNVTDRRAGRISTETNQKLCEKLRSIKVPDVEVFVQTVKEHRFLLVLRGRDLSGQIHDTDPQETGVPPLEPKAIDPGAQPTIEKLQQFLKQARDILKDSHPANGVLLRGFSKHPDWPTMQEAFGIRSAAIAAYPMYRGLGKLLGMKTLPTGQTLQEELETLKKAWNDYDFFFVHFKKTDSSGEDGDFQRKVHAIEHVDEHLPALFALNPDVVIVTGDHSTPAVLRFHSWHPVPALLYSKHCRPDQVCQFGETACLRGGLGPAFPAVNLIPLALANAGRLEKFGA